MCIYIYIYIERERENERNIKRDVYVCIYIYIYVYIEREMSRTNGVNTNGAAAKVNNIDRLGETVRPGALGNITSRSTRIPQTSLCHVVIVCLNKYHTRISLSLYIYIYTIYIYIYIYIYIH